MESSECTLANAHSTHSLFAIFHMYTMLLVYTRNGSKGIEGNALNVRSLDSKIYLCIKTKLKKKQLKKKFSFVISIHPL